MNTTNRQTPEQYFSQTIEWSSIERLMALGIIIVGVVAIVALVTFKRK